MPISDYYGKVKRCDCNPKNTEMPVCRSCFGRGFVAECMNCEGTGMVTSGVCGDAKLGTMKSTCNVCGGRGCFGVKQPDNWVDPVSETEVVAQ